MSGSAEPTVIRALVSPEEEPIVRHAARDLGAALVIERDRDGLLRGLEGVEVVVVGNDQSRGDRVSTVRRVAEGEGDPVLVGIAEDLPLKVEFFEAGATVVVSRRDPPALLVDGVRAARAGRARLDPEAAAAVLQRLQHVSRLCVDQEVDLSRCDALSPREREVAGLLARRSSNQQVADELGISVGTVKAHVHRILRKLDVDNRRLAGVYWTVYEGKEGRPW